MSKSSTLLILVGLGAVAVLIWLFRAQIGGAINSAITPSTKQASSQAGSSNTASGQSIVYAPTYDYNQENSTTLSYSTNITKTSSTSNYGLLNLSNAVKFP